MPGKGRPSYSWTQERREKAARNLQAQRALHPEWGPDSTTEQRREAAAELRALGCSYNMIADVFHCSTETIRHDLLPGREVRGWSRKITASEYRLLSMLRELDGDQDGPSLQKVLALAERTLAKRHRPPLEGLA